jgi:hypothetical protein
LPISVFPTAASLSSSSGRPSPIIKQSAIASTSFNDGYSKEAFEAARVHRLVWLNPLLGWQGYAPVARAMAVALDYVDCFATAHSPASLAALEDELARL